MDRTRTAEQLHKKSRTNLRQHSSIKSDSSLYSGRDKQPIQNCATQVVSAEYDKVQRKIKNHPAHTKNHPLQRRTRSDRNEKRKRKKQNKKQNKKAKTSAKRPKQNYNRIYNFFKAAVGVNFKAFRAGILIFFPVEGLTPTRAFLRTP